MDLQRMSSSSSPSPPSSAHSSAEDAADQTELEAAEALADLAQLAIMREKVAESAAKWGSKGKRVRKRVKNETPPTDLRLNPVDSEAPFPDLSEDGAVQEEEQARVISRNLTLEPVKVEVDDESPKLSQASDRRCRSTGGGRSRQSLTEAEKEARRIRRVLANRESARQTIRRRQALSEEFTRKAADLISENERLKREKDMALQEYQSLETINKHLKEQISKSIKTDAGKAQEEPKSSHVEVADSTPFYFYNQHPFQLLCWPSIIQPSHTMHTQEESKNGCTAPSITPTIGHGNFMPSEEQENPVNDNGPRTPLYVVPCPWFISHPNQRNGVQPQLSFGSKNAQCGITTTNHYQSDNSSAKNVADIENLSPHFPSKIKEEDSGSTESRPFCELNESATEFPSEGVGSHIIGFHPKDHQGSAGPTFILKHEDVSQSTDGAIPTKPGRVLVSLPEKKQEIVEYPGKKLVDAVAAAEARKRRKELTRLKNLHGRQYRMQV